MTSLEISERLVAQHGLGAMPKAVGIEFNRYFAGADGVQGNCVRINFRDGLDLSALDLRVENNTTRDGEADACVCIQIMLAGAGRGDIVDSCDGKLLFSVPYQSGTTYISVTRTKMLGHSQIPADTVVQGLDFRLSRAFLRRLGKEQLFYSLDRYHPFCCGVTDDVWVGRIPTPNDVERDARTVFATAFSNSGHDIGLEGKALGILSFIFDAVEKQHTVDPTRAVPPREARQIKQAHDLLMEDISTTWTIPELARRTGLNEKALKKGFRALFGAPVYKYLQTRRLDTARRMLVFDAVSVTQVSLAVGYANPSHFSYLYKRRFGICPSKAHDNQ